MKLTIVAVGRAPASLGELLHDFEQRARRYWKLEVVEVPSGAGGGQQEEAKVRQAEARRIREKIPKGAEMWALTREGREFSSGAFAKALEERALRSSPGIAFLLGGAFGLDPELIEEARERFSLSRMTLPHGLARLFLSEQLYRAGTILKNEPYHKGRE